MAEFGRCYGCMSELHGAAHCPHCGYVNGTGRVSSLHIEPGSVLKGRYVVGRALGQGGFGITYIAWDNIFDRAAAIKEYLPPSLATRNTDGPSVTCASENLKEDYEYGLRKFLDEARILAMFTDMPNIVGVRDFFRANGTAYMVMEYVDGITFKEYIARRGGKVRWDEAEGILSFVADALRAVHSHGLLHRDVSPDNIYITESKQIKLLDFGAARLALEAQNRGFSVVLKHGYAPAEQYKTNGSQGPWTDIYALAATYYTSVTGKLPPDALDRLERDTLVPPSELGADMPRGKEKALLKALAVHEADRFQRVEDFVAALKAPESPAPAEAPESYVGPVASAAHEPAAWKNSAAAARYAPYAVIGVSLILFFALIFKSGFGLSWAERMEFTQQKSNAPQAVYSTPVPPSPSLSDSAALPTPQRPAAAQAPKPQTKVKPTVPAKKTGAPESEEARLARAEVEKARREVEEEKKRAAEKEALRKEIKIHTGAHIGAGMLMND